MPGGKPGGMPGGGMPRIPGGMPGGNMPIGGMPGGNIPGGPGGPGGTSSRLGEPSLAENSSLSIPRYALQRARAHWQAVRAHLAQVQDALQGADPATDSQWLP